MSLREVKNRIKSIQSTRQITGAMELVAASKLKSVKDRAEKSTPFFDALKNSVEDIAFGSYDNTSPYLSKTNPGQVLHIVIAGDRGLAGGYNSNVLNMNDFPKEDLILPIGKKAVEFFPDEQIISRDYQKAQSTDFSDCILMGELINTMFLDGKVSKVIIHYTKFINAIIQKPESHIILPLAFDTNRVKKQILYEPSLEEVFSHIVPMYISGIIYGALCSSVASEISARRNSMRSANENADEMLDNLRLQYNRTRQAQITSELTEIVNQ